MKDLAADEAGRADAEPLLLCSACGHQVVSGALRCAGCGMAFRGSARGSMVRLDLDVEIVGGTARLTIQPVDVDAVEGE